MKVYVESDRVCTVDGVGLLEPGVPVEVNQATFKVYHGVSPINANFPSYIKTTIDTTKEPEPEENEDQ